MSRLPPALLLAFALAALAAAPALGQSPAAEDCNARTGVPAQIECFLRAAEAAKSADICTAASEPATRFNCLGLYAERSRDPAACALIDAALGDQQALQDACVAGVAVARVDPELCETVALGAMRDACLMTLITTHDLDRAYCARIEEATLKAACSDGD